MPLSAQGLDFHSGSKRLNMYGGLVQSKSFDHRVFSGGALSRRLAELTAAPISLGADPETWLCSLNSPLLPLTTSAPSFPQCHSCFSVFQCSVISYSTETWLLLIPNLELPFQLILFCNFQHIVKKMTYTLQTKTVTFKLRKRGKECM